MTVTQEQCRDAASSTHDPLDPAETRQSASPRASAQASASSDAKSAVGLRVVPIRHWGRWIVSAVIVFVAAQFVWSLFTNRQYGWDVFAEYFFDDAVINGLWLTLWLTVISIVGGFVIGTVLAMFRLSKSPLLNAFASAYIWFFRSVPLLVQILVCYNLGYLYPTLGAGNPVHRQLLDH